MKKTLLFFLFFTFLPSFCQNLQAQLPDFSFTDTKGHDHNLFQYLQDGKLVILECFYTTCGNCIDFAPTLQEIYEENGVNEEDVIVLTFEVQNASDSEIDAWKNNLDTNIPACGGNDVWNYWGDHVYSLIGGAFTQVLVLQANISNVTEHEIIFTGMGMDSEKTAELRTVIETFKLANEIDTTVVDTLLPPPTAIDVINKALIDIQIVPNPIQSQTTLYLTTQNQQDPIDLVLFDLKGQQLDFYRTIQYPQESNQILLDLPNLPTSTYILQISQGGFVEQRKIFVK